MKMSHGMQISTILLSYIKTSKIQC